MSESSKHTKLAGEWLTVSHSNLEPMLEKLGAPFIIRKVAPRAKPSQKISFDGSKMYIITETGFMTKESVVLIDGTEFNDEMFQKPLVATAVVNETGSITLQGKIGSTDINILREVNDEDQMVLTINAGDVECVRKFSRK